MQKSQDLDLGGRNLHPVAESIEWSNIYPAFPSSSHAAATAVVVVVGFANSALD